MPSLPELPLDLPGIENDGSGNLRFTLTDEEEREVDAAFAVFSDCLFHPDHAGDAEKTIRGHALHMFSVRQAEAAGLCGDEKQHHCLLGKAIAAITKAYSFSQVPVYLYWLGCLLDAGQRADDARSCFFLFLEKQATFKPSLVEEGLLRQLDVSAAVEDARRRTT